MRKPTPTPRELRLLGGIQIVDREGGDLTAEVPRRHLGVLAVLAGGGPGSMTRETLAGLLWPDHDPERARNNLSQAVHGLRRVLGEEAIVASRVTVQLSPGHIDADVWRFEQLIQDGALEAAVAEYRGPFLQGFEASGVDAVTRWTHERREQLAAAHQHALMRLARAAEAGGDHSTAVHWWGELVRTDPLSSAAAVGFIRALAAAGDRIAALDHAQRYRERVKQELHADPDPALAELAESLGGVALPPAAPQAIIGRTEPRRSSRGARFRRVVAPALPFLVIGLGVVLWQTVRGRGIAPGGDEPIAVAVLPFKVTGDLDPDEFGEGIVGILAAGLDGAGALRSLPSGTVLQAVGDQEDLLPAEAEDLASDLGARLYVLGEINEAGGRLRLSAGVYDTDAGEQPVSTASVEGSDGEFLILVDRLAAQLIAHRFDRPSDRLARAAAGSTTSLAAVKAWLTGEELFHNGRYAEATDAFAEATAEDSTFALAYFRQAMAADMAGRDADARRAAARALALRERLTPHDARLVEAYSAWREGAFTVATRTLRQLVIDYPDDAEAWLALGMILIQANPLHGRPSEDARSSFERVLSLDGENPEALLSLARLADLAGDAARADSLLDALERLTETHRVTTLRAFRSFVFGDGPGIKPSTSYVIAGEDVAPLRIQLDLAARADDVNTQELFARALLENDPGNPDNPAHRMLSRISLARGQVRLAAREISSGPGAENPRALLLSGLHAAYDFLPESASNAAAALERMRSWIPPDSADPSDSDLYARMLPELRLHRIGLLTARLGRRGEARDAADSIERMAVRSGPKALLARMLACSVRAHAAFAEGRPDEALAWLDRASWPHGADLFESEAYDRWLRAEALEQLGRKREALAWYATLGERSAVEIGLRAPAALRGAALLDELGEPEEALRLYRRFVELWSDSDPELRGDVAKANARIAELSQRTRPSPR